MNEWFRLCLAESDDGDQLCVDFGILETTLSIYITLCINLAVVRCGPVSLAQPAKPAYCASAGSESWESSRVLQIF